MPRRTGPVLVALSIVVAACGQALPERSALPSLPDEFVFPATTTTTLDPIPDDGSCYLVESVGARVRSTQPGYDAANHLESADVIVAVGEDAVTSQETLVGALARYAPGDPVVVTFERAGIVQEATTILGSRRDDPTVPLLGVIVEPAIVARTPGEVAAYEGDPGARLLLIADGQVFLVDPLRGEWRATGAAAPEGPLLLFDGAPYTAVPGEGPALTPLAGAGDAVAVPTGGTLLLTALTAIGDVVVAAVADVAPDDTAEPLALSVVALNTTTGAVEWSWAPQDDAGTVATPLLGYRSPDGSALVVTSEVAGGRVHTLFDAVGTPIAGFGTNRDFAPTGAAFIGWFDDGVAAYAAGAGETLDVVTVDLADLSTELVATFDAADGLRQLWSVGDGRTVVGITEDETWLYDLDRRARGRTLARDCGVTVRDGPGI